MATSNSNQLSPQAKDETGNVYGKLTVVAFSHLDREVHWFCQCECGNTTIVRGSHLRSGQISSCGCRLWSIGGLSSMAEYGIWTSMKQRCCNSRDRQFYLYGGRGISVCQRWRTSFANFLADMGPKPFPEASIDRIDNDGNYEPQNCRWATKIQQSQNSRKAKLIAYNGETLSVRSWARRFGIPCRTLHNRITNGWTIAKALTTPPIPRCLRAAHRITTNV